MIGMHVTPHIRLTVPHWYNFDDSIRPHARTLEGAASWDELRMRDESGAFGLGATVEEWRLRASSQADLQSRAATIGNLLRGWGTRKLVSVGVGNGMLEYLVKQKASEIEVRCGDYAPRSLAALRERFPDCSSVELMDLRRFDWTQEPGEVVLFHRVDMELRNSEWKDVFSGLANRGVERIIWVPCGLLNAAAIGGQVRAVLTAITARRRLTRTGYLRSQARMLSLFAPHYRRSTVRSEGDLPIWALAKERRRP